MKVNTEVVDKFEYKGKEIVVHKDGNNKHYFVYKEEGKDVTLPISQINNFIESPFAHTTINNNIVDMIEKSVKINDFIYNLKDLKTRIKKYN